MEKCTIGLKSVRDMPKAWQLCQKLLDNGAKFKNSNVTKPMKNTPSQDGAEEEQGGRSSDLFTKG